MVGKLFTRFKCMKLIIFYDKYRFVAPNGKRSFCGLEIYEESKKSRRVVLIEKIDNYGMSITNAAEELATEIFNKFLSDINPYKITWLEKYEKYEKYGKKDTVDQVIFEWEKNRFINPAWRRIKF